MCLLTLFTCITDSDWILQVVQEVNWLNESCASEVLVLEKQMLDIGELIQERKKKIDLNNTAAHAGKQRRPKSKVDSDPELQILIKEQKSITHRSVALHPSLSHQRAYGVF